jgi:16S rRNA (cytidine1402-2'-O)-methyltransferase
MAKAFHGYLPIEKTRRKRVLKLRTISLKKNQSQIFIETPYRNNKLLEDLIQTLIQKPIYASTDITLPTEYIKKKIAAWKKKPSTYINGHYFHYSQM